MIAFLESIALNMDSVDCAFQNVYISRYPVKHQQANMNSCSILKSVSLFEIDQEFASISLSEILLFCSQLQAVENRHAQPEPQTIVVCPKIHTRRFFTHIAFLVGAHMILCHGCSFDQVERFFSNHEGDFEQMLVGDPLSDDCSSFSASDCWDALATFRTHRLADTRQEQEPDLLLDLEEILHYASPINGSVSIVLPGRLLLFESPADLPPRLLWTDEAAGERRQGCRGCQQL